MEAIHMTYNFQLYAENNAVIDSNENVLKSMSKVPEF